MVFELLKALLIGLLASMPPGPVSVLVMQKTFCDGRGSGYAAGAGSALIDTLYSVVSLFAVAVVANFITANENITMIVGGTIIVLVGWSLLVRKEVKEFKINVTTSSKAVQSTLQAAGCALANPGALAYMFALVSMCQLDIRRTEAPAWLLVLMVFAGACAWWFMYVFAVDKLRSRFRPQTLNIVTKVELPRVP